MKDERDYRLDLSSAAGVTPEAHPTAAAGSTKRPFISVHFTCCNVYLRIYRSPDGTAYRGQCPRCARPVNFPVGQGGTDVRFFRAG
jgi:hypothetical protein